MISLKLSKEIDKRLTRIADLTGRSKNFYIKEAIREHLNSLENMYVDDKILRNIESNRDDSVSLDEMIIEHSRNRSKL